MDRQRIAKAVDKTVLAVTTAILRNEGRRLGPKTIEAIRTVLEAAMSEALAPAPHFVRGAFREEPTDAGMRHPGWEDGEDTSPGFANKPTTRPPKR